MFSRLIALIVLTFLASCASYNDRETASNQYSKNERLMNLDR
jgi:hypothetical protein